MIAEIAIGFGASVAIPAALYWLVRDAEASGEVDLCAPMILPPRAPAVASVGTVVPVAALFWSPLPMQPCAHLIGIAEILNAVAAPLLDAETHRAACLAACPPGGRTYRDTAAIFDEGALHAGGLKQAEDLLRRLAHDPAYQRFAEEQTFGGPIVGQEADGPRPIVVAREYRRPDAQPVATQDEPKGFLGRLWPARRAAA